MGTLYPQLGGRGWSYALLERFTPENLFEVSIAFSKRICAWHEHLYLGEWLGEVKELKKAKKHYQYITSYDESLINKAITLGLRAWK